MARGGYHEHAERWGRRSSWQTEGATRTIRVPEALAEQILELAHKLDNGELIASDTKAITELEELRAKIAAIALAVQSIPKNRELVRGRDGGAVKRALEPIKKLLTS